MANLGGITQYQNQFQTGQNLANAGSVSSGASNAVNGTVEGAGGLRQELMQMGKGTVFTGTVTQMRDGNVTVSLDNGQTLHARLDSGVSVNMGQPVLFEVKSNQNNQLMLRQVPVDSAYNPTLQKALAAAGLPVSGRNLAMVNAMMQNQLPINKSSLLAMARQLQTYPGVSAESLAQMKKLGFPITETMVQQFEAYKQGNHSLVERFTQMMDQLPLLLSEAKGDQEQLLKLQEGLLRALEILEEPGAAEGLREGAQASSNPSGSVLPEGAQAILEGAKGAEAKPGTEHPASVKDVSESLTRKDAAGNLTENGAVPGKEGAALGKGAAEGLARQDPSAVSKGGRPETITDPKELPKSQDGRGIPVSEFLDRGRLEGLESQLRQLGMGEDPVLFPGGRMNTSLDAREMLGAIARLLEQQKQALGEAGGEKIKSLFSQKGYQGLLKQALSEQWLLEPRQVEQEQAVEKLYERLNRQMNRLSQLMEQAGKSDGAVAKNTTQVRGNLEMMQQINHLYNYVQIPLKLRGQNAHSDLYVYTNKKNLRDREGELSALLHLELDHLGVTDVRIRMLGSHVTTNFCMADEAALELVEDHLEELTEALSRKGYQCSIETERKQEEMDFVQDFLEHEAPIGKLARYSFDVLT